jgi:hypothetical protein
VHEMLADYSRQLSQLRMLCDAVLITSVGCLQPFGLVRSRKERGHGLRHCSQLEISSTLVRIKLGGMTDRSCSMRTSVCWLAGKFTLEPSP